MLGLIYRLFKIFLDGTGFIWKSGWAMDLKLALNKQCNAFFARLHQADNDTFATLLRGLLVVIAIALYCLSALSIKIGIFKAETVNIKLIASALIVYAIFVCSTTEAFWGNVKDMFKLIKIYFVIWGIIFSVAFALAAIGQYFTNPDYTGKILDAKLFQDIVVTVIAQVPAKTYVYTLLPALVPLALLGVPFYANRWLVFPLLRKLIAKSLKDSPKEPFKILFFAGLVVKTIYSAIFK